MPYHITSRVFGHTPQGVPVLAWVLHAPSGMMAEVITYGATLTRLLVPDNRGALADVVLGFPSLDGYLGQHPYFGAIVGRVAGRVSSASFMLDGKRYRLDANEGANHLHGGLRGFNRRLWAAEGEVRSNEARVRFEYTSKAGEEGYPATIRVMVTYRLQEQMFSIESEATTDAATPLSMTHHSYFNLAGEGSGSIHEHSLQILADEVVAVDGDLTLLDAIQPVSGSNDLREAKGLRKVIPGLFRGHGDLYRLTARDTETPRHVAQLRHEASGRCMDVWTNERYLQFYTGVSLDGSLTGKSGTAYDAFAGVCLECEGYPNGTDNAVLGDIVLRNGETQRRETSYRFSASPCASSSTVVGAMRYEPDLPARRDFKIGVLGSGFIVNDCHLVSYKRAGFNPVAIASRQKENAERVAKTHGIAQVYDSYEALLDDPSIEVLDIAVPPMHQLPLIRAACARGKVKGILAQKPLALTFEDALAATELCERSGILLSVNQNMRYDPTVYAAKRLLNEKALGDLVFATLDMRAIPHWQPWQADIGSATMKIMSVHHLDCMRFWFGEPQSVFCSTRPDPRTTFAHTDGICTTVLTYAGGLQCVIIDDVWTGPAKEGAPGDIGIRWRIEGQQGLAMGELGWCKEPYTTPSTMRFARKGDSEFRRYEPSESWFPDAFASTMGQLLVALDTHSLPVLTARDNLRTIALVEAALQSAAEQRVIYQEEFKTGTHP